jgi:hypothetical protein
MMHGQKNIKLYLLCLSNVSSAVHASVAKVSTLDSSAQVCDISEFSPYSWWIFEKLPAFDSLEEGILDFLSRVIKICFAAQMHITKIYSWL